MFGRCWLLAVLALSLTTAAAAADRTWTSTDGRTMRARFVREVDGEVTFVKEGKLVTIPLERLSPDDQQIVRDLAAGKPVPDDLPAENPFEPVENPLQAVAPEASETDAVSLPEVAEEADERPRSVKKRSVPIVSRSWADQRGRQITGRFVRIHNGQVVITRTGGRVVTVPFYNLSQADQDYVRELLAARGEEETIPPPPPQRSDGDSGMPGDVAMPGPGPGGPRGGFGMPGGIGGMPGGMGGMPGGGMPGPGPFSAEPRFPGGGGFPVRMPEPSVHSAPDYGSGTISGPDLSPLERMRQQNEDMLERMRADREQRNLERVESLRQAEEERQRAFEDSQRQLREQRERLRQNEIIGECLSCKGRLTQSQADGKKCPHCGVTWDYEIDEFGQKKRINNSSPFSSTTSPRVPLDPETQARAVRIVIGVVAVLGAMVLAVVMIVVAIAIASTGSRKPQQYM